ncbi:phage tail assembly protein [Burkholderia sp. BCCIQ04A]|uniref:Phage tail assembly protein n=1 Tax=Burkholderia anthinoferrum TaxID=3090833 RepID=A0ABU5WZ38_9BURK|nr:phage tail assembly protein [Burkholderia anthinoferrum]MEB2504643.1 phage tail assembly protein [Burkholderia anthinoferrum]MEB2530311.1 phage tail assembly protein [Burkholderia anthinoferrum]MEB2561684.1 phage tail assembly protein [Burkholderia anthinoferrum]MEB2583939.1 phage tail assembly protein [Burkholderia anthinoferrum]MEB2634456.1 phage tail assembly protein [Burkholderia anthinoferrum]
MSDTKTIQLRKPLTYGKGADEKTVSEITLREPLAGDYEQAESSAGVFGTSIALVALLSGVPVDVIDEMYGSQIDEAEDFIASFGHDIVRNPAPSPDEIVLTLSTPVKLTSDDSPLNIASLTLSEPTNRQKRKAAEAGGPFAGAVAMISMIGKVPKSAVRGLCARDFLQAIGYFNGFQVRRSPDSDD